MKEAWIETCEETCGRKTRQHKEWISGETLQKIQTRKQAKDKLNTSRTRAAKAKAQQDYTTLDKLVKQSIRKDKKQFINNLATQAEEAAAQHNMKALYDITRKLANKRKTQDRPILDKEGKTLTKQEDQLKRWAEHFSDITSQHPSLGTPPTAQHKQAQQTRNKEGHPKTKTQQSTWT